MNALTFNSERHEYRLGGRLVPHVTGILAGLNLVDTSWFTEESRLRGQAVHQAIHYHLEGDLDWSTVQDRFKGYVEAAILFLDDAKAVIDSTELRLVHGGAPIFAGTADVVGELFGDASVVDWKSGAIGEVTGLQVAAYDIALGGGRRRRMGVQLKANGKYSKPHDLTERQDYPRFLAAADLFNRYIFKGEKSVAAA
jgi:hypothetical protein